MSLWPWWVANCFWPLGCCWATNPWWLDFHFNPRVRWAPASSAIMHLTGGSPSLLAWRKFQLKLKLTAGKNSFKARRSLDDTLLGPSMLQPQCSASWHKAVCSIHFLNTSFNLTHLFAPPCIRMCTLNEVLYQVHLFNQSWLLICVS